MFSHQIGIFRLVQFRANGEFAGKKCWSTYLVEIHGFVGHDFQQTWRRIKK